MTHIRRPLLGLLALFVIAIAIDRLGVASGTSAIDSYVYVIALAAAAGPFAIPSLRRSRPWSSLILAGIAYVTAGTLAGSANDIYVVTTEVGFLTLATVLGQQLASAATRLDEALGNAAFGESPALDIEGPVAANEIHTEIARSRRHDRPLTVTVVAPEPVGLEDALSGAAVEIQRSLRRRFVLGGLARTVGKVLRRSDLLFEHRETGRFVILSPETDSEGNSLLVRRLKDAAAESGLNIATGTAAFPDHAISFEQLVAHAETELETDLTPPALRAVTQERSA